MVERPAGAAGPLRSLHAGGSSSFEARGRESCGPGKGERRDAKSCVLVELLWERCGNAFIPGNDHAPHVPVRGGADISSYRFVRKAISVSGRN